MAEDGRDVLMKWVLDGQAIPAECQALVARGDDLGTGFVHISRSGGRGVQPNYFLIEDFTFEVALSGDNSAKDKMTAEKGDKNNKNMQDYTKQQNAALAKYLQQNAPPGTKVPANLPGMPDLKLGNTKDSAEFGRFMANGRAAMRQRTFPADLEEVSVTKQMDESSMTLLKACLNSTTFNSATLLKRKATGQQDLRGYMRIDFTDVMITEFNWTEDDPVKETFKFVCRQAVVQYSIEEDSGKLRPQGTRKWSVLNLSSG